MLRFAREKFKIFIRLALKFYKDQWSKYKNLIIMGDFKQEACFKKKTISL